MSMDREGNLKNLDEWGLEYKDKLGSLEAMGASQLVDIAMRVGDFLANGKFRARDGKEHKMNLKMNQIRRFLDGVRRIESELKGKAAFQEMQDRIVLLRPKLAYAAGREEKVKPLMNILDPAISSGARSKENFEKLLRLVESIVAYHRFYGGSN